MKKITIITKSELEIGDIQLRKEPHPSDANAVRVYQKESPVGYVAASPHTVEEGTIPAGMLKEEFNKIAPGKVLNLVRSEGGIFSYLAVLQVEKEKANRVLEFQLTGGTTTFPAKMDLLKATKAGHQAVRLVLDGDRIVGEFSGVPAGAVKADEETFDMLKQHVEDTPEVIAEATGADRGQIACTLTLVPNVVVESRRVSLEAVIEKILEEGLDTQEALDEKLEYLRKNKVPEVAIASLFESYQSYPAEIAARIPERPKVLYVDSSGLVKKSVAFMNVGDNLRFEGDKGVGKNVLTETLAWLYARPLYEFSSNSQQSNNSLLGGKTFADNEEDTSDDAQKSTVWSIVHLAGIFKKVFLKGEKADISEAEVDQAKVAVLRALGKQDKKLVFEMSSILEAFINGGIIVLDEFNTSLAHVMPVFNSLLDDRRRMEITGYGRALGHKNFVAISTMNRDYEGTFEGNEATMDRFVPILFPALSTITPILQEKVPGISYEVAVLANKVYLGLKEAVVAGTLSSQALSIRGFISACKVLNQGVTLKESLVDSVANRINDVDERNSVIEIIELQLD